MITSFILTLREAVEAVLIIGILISLVNKTQPKHGARMVYGGAIAAVLVSVAVAQIFGEAYSSFGTSIEGISGLLAVALLSYMVFWMGEQSKHLQQELREKAANAISNGKAWSLGILAFLSVLREGIETVLFLISTAETSPFVQVITGGALGILMALILAALLFRGLLKINLQKFFTRTSYLLIMFGAGILGKATADLQAAGWLPGTIAAWNTNWLVNESSPLGALLGGILGYSSSPTLLQVFVYLGYLVTAVYLFHFSGEQKPSTVSEYGHPFQSVGTDYQHWVYRVVRSRWIPKLPMYFFTLIFVVLLVVALWNIPVGHFTGQGDLNWGKFSTKAENNLFIFLVWVIWLPLISISAVFLGRFWCGNLCPLRLLTEGASKVGDCLRGRQSSSAPYLRAGWVLPTTFVLITIFVRVFDFQSEARYGAYLFLGIVLSALIVGFLFRKGTWCRYVCPIGGWLARIARLSVLGVRPRKPACESCTDKPCIHGRVLTITSDQLIESTACAERCPVFLAPNRLESSQHCLQCWNCVKNCPKERSGMRIGLRLPGAELFKPYAPDLGEAVYISALLGMYMAVTMQGIVWPQLPFLITLALFMGLSAIGYAGLSYFVSLLSGISWREVITTIGYAFLPMEWATAIITMGDDSLEFFNIMVPASAVLLGIGFVWSLVLGTSILLHRAPNKMRAIMGLLPVIIVIFLLLLFWSIRFLSGQVIDLT
ncbi:Ferrous iron transport permease EfeU [Desulfosporosinus sp. I2]|uniref:FTR1 family protein n=1 Tax=Desulfosporosinus sp. I2 TaxID=1617025 RepID=UPI00061FBC53|nr:FTR1 family protein [Desulfosporosinus sp. I2]KJR44310.1 Ferrous iron transport permease EfeU [Desulfosporosinus sp. I2]